MYILVTFLWPLLKQREQFPWLKAICWHEMLYIPLLVSYVLHRKKQSYLVAWTYMRHDLWKKQQANEPECKRPMEMTICLSKWGLFCTRQIFSIYYWCLVQRDCLWISSSQLLPFSMIVLINWAPLSGGFQAGFLIYTYKKANKQTWRKCFTGKRADQKKKKFRYLQRNWQEKVLFFHFLLVHTALLLSGLH